MTDVLTDAMTVAAVCILIYLAVVAAAWLIP